MDSSSPPSPSTSPPLPTQGAAPITRSTLTSEAGLHNSFKAAALSLTHFYKSSVRSSKRAGLQGQIDAYNHIAQVLESAQTSSALREQGICVRDEKGEVFINADWLLALVAKRTESNKARLYSEGEPTPMMAEDDSSTQTLQPDSSVDALGRSLNSSALTANQPMQNPHTPTHSQTTPHRTVNEAKRQYFLNLEKGPYSFSGMHPHAGYRDPSEPPLKRSRHFDR